MRCSILAVAVLATVAWGAPVLQGAPRQPSGPVKPDLLRSATTCTGRNPLTFANGLPSGLVSSRSVAGVRWINAAAPGIALWIIGQNTVLGADAERLNAFISGLVINMERQANDVQEQRMPLGLRAYEGGAADDSRFLFSICPLPSDNPVLTWEAVHRVLSSLSWYMATEGGFRTLQYHAFTAGATPAQDVQFATGEITMRERLPGSLQARSLPALVGSGRR